MARRDAYRASEGRVKVGYVEQCAQLPAMKELFPWLGLLPAQALQQTLLDLDRAYVNFFQGRSRYPAFKKRSGRTLGLRWPQGVAVNGRCLRLPKLGWVKARFSRPWAGRIKSATVKSDGLHWQATLLVEEEAWFSLEARGPDVGIDVGITESVACSDPRLIRLPVATPVERRRLAILARRVSLRRRLAFRGRIGNRVSDARHKLTSTLAKNHGRVFVEDLALRSLTRSAGGTVEAPGRNVAAKASLNRALLAQGIGETFRQLEHKLGWEGAHFRKVPAARTSQRCPKCDHTGPENRPTRDRFQCVACGYTDHADIVGAINTLAAGQAATARGGPRGPMNREPSRLQRLNRSKAGISAL